MGKWTTIDMGDETNVVGATGVIAALRSGEAARKIVEAHNASFGRLAVLSFAVIGPTGLIRVSGWWGKCGDSKELGEMVKFACAEETSRGGIVIPNSQLVMEFEGSAAERGSAWHGNCGDDAAAPARADSAPARRIKELT